MCKLFSSISLSSECMQMFDGHHGPMGSWWWMSIDVNDDLEPCSVGVQGGLCLFKEFRSKPFTSLMPPKSLDPSESWLMSNSSTSSPPSKVPHKHGDNDYIDQSPPICNSPQLALPHPMGGSGCNYSCPPSQSSSPTFAETIKFGMGRTDPLTNPTAAQGDTNSLSSTLPVPEP